MEDVAIVGIDLAKSVFQVHGIDLHGQVVLRRKLSRSKLLTFFDFAASRCEIAETLPWKECAKITSRCST